MPFKITETAGFIALSLAGRLEAWIAACSASVTRRSSCLTCSRKVLSSSCVCASATWDRPSAAATASAMVPFLCMLSLQVLAIAMHLEGRSRTRSLRASEAGYRATELGEDGGRARIEFDPRRKRQGKYDRRDGRQRDLGRLDRQRKRGERAVDRVIRDALLCGMADGRDALAAALGPRHVVLQMRQRVQLRRLLREDERGGKKQVSQSAVRHGRRYRQHRVQVYYKASLMRDRSNATPRRASASARGATAPRWKALPSAARSAGGCRSALPFPRSSRSCPPRCGARPRRFS